MRTSTNVSGASWSVRLVLLWSISWPMHVLLLNIWLRRIRRCAVWATRVLIECILSCKLRGRRLSELWLWVSWREWGWRGCRRPRRGVWSSKLILRSGCRAVRRV